MTVMVFTNKVLYICFLNEQVLKKKSLTTTAGKVSDKVLDDQTLIFLNDTYANKNKVREWYTIKI
jgi:hypothetical protein